jgi:MFS family permease
MTTLAARLGGGLGANYWRLWTASAVSNLADGVFWIALPLLALRLTTEPMLIAGVTLANRVPWLVFVLFAGAYADRLDRRRTMTLVQVVRAGLAAVLAVSVVTGTVGLPLLYAIALVLGIAETFFDTAAQSMMPSVVDKDQLSRANGRLYGVEIVTNTFIGPPIGGLLAATAMVAAFGSAAIGYAFAAFALVLLTGSFRPQRQGPPKRIVRDIGEGLAFLLRHRLLRTFAFMVGMMNLASSAVFALLVLYAVAPGPLGLSEAGFGLLGATFAIGSLAGSILAERFERALGRSRLLLLCVAIPAIGTAVPGVLVHPVAVAVGFSAAGMFSVMWNVITVSLRQRIVPDDMLGRMNAAYRLLAWGTMPIGAALGGVVGELFGIQPLFLLAGGLTGLLLLLAPLISETEIRAAESAAPVPLAAPAEA